MIGNDRERIYIVVKTYPTISKEYSELVCTAGIREDGSWVRLYPVPFRKLSEYKKYRKYSWISANITRNRRDFRPETFRPDIDSIIIDETKAADSAKPNWEERKRIIFKNTKVYTNLKEIITKSQTKGDCTSLAIFKPTTIVDFTTEETTPNWDEDKLESLKKLSIQLPLFQTIEQTKNEFKVVAKVPYKFKYVFTDDVGKKASLMIEDWEIGMLYFNCLKAAKGNKEEALKKVREKYYGEFTKKDLYFFLGTTLRHQMVSKNPFIIIGVFAPPIRRYETKELFSDK